MNPVRNSVTPESMTGITLFYYEYCYYEYCENF